MCSRAGSAVVLAVLFVASACGGDPPAPVSTEPITLEELRQASYTGFAEIDRAVTLTDGSWEDASAQVAVSLARDVHVEGDLDGGLPAESAVVLGVSTPAGSTSYLAVVGRRDGVATNLASVPLGPSVQIRDLRIENRRLVASVVRPGPGDAMCCPGELASRSWILQGSALTEAASSEVSSRLSLETIAGTPWVLRSWALDETAPVQPEVTLEIRDGRAAGSSGCNRYTADVSAGEAPGDVTIGPAAGTRMMCPEAEMQIEERFLEQLRAVRKFGFLVGQLALTYDVDGKVDVMLFARP